MTKQILGLIDLALVVVLSGCFPGGGSYSPLEPAGFGGLAFSRKRKKKDGGSN